MVTIGGPTSVGGRGASQGVPEPRLVRAAHEFEAQLMKELLRPMTSGNGWLGGDQDEAGGTGTLGEFASESLAGALSVQGGFGIGDRIIHEVSRSGNRCAASPVIGNLQMNTGISARK